MCFVTWWGKRQSVHIFLRPRGLPRSRRPSRACTQAARLLLRRPLPDLLSPAVPKGDSQHVGRLLTPPHIRKRSRAGAGPGYKKVVAFDILFLSFVFLFRTSWELSPEVLYNAVPLLQPGIIFLIYPFPIKNRL